MRRSIARFFRRHPLLGFALAATLAVAAIHGGGWWLAGSFGVVLGLAAWLSEPRATALAFLCMTLAAGGVAFREHRREAATERLTRPASVEATGSLLGDAEVSAWGWEGRVKLTEPVAGAVVVWRGTGESPVAGAVVSAVGRFAPPEGPRNPGEFDERVWATRQGIAAEFSARFGSGEIRTGPWAATGAKLRRAFRDSVTAGLREDSRAASVIRAVVIGDYPKNDDALIGAFRNSGTLHVFSVSGLHVAMVGFLGWGLLRWLRVPRRVAVPVLIALMFSYAWLTGNSPPALRSAWMAAVFLGAFALRRRPDLLNALGAVLLAAVLWDGRLLWQPGVQLSYGVVAAIAVGTTVFSRLFGRFARPDPYLPRVLLTPLQEGGLWFRRKIAGDASASCAAWLGSTPLTWWHFGLITPVSMVASLVLVPFVFLLLAAGLGSAVVHPFAPAASVQINRANGQIAQATAWLAARFSAVPGGNVRVARANEPRLLVFDLDHGAGAACFSVQSGAVLLDVGDRPGFRRRVLSSLRTLGIEPDSVVLSHPDGGHVGAGEEVTEAFPIRQVLLPVERARSKGYQYWLKAEGLRKIPARQGERLPMPDSAELEVLFAPDPMAWDAVADDRVAIYRLHWRGWRILFLSDAGWKAERRLLDSGIDFRADVLVAGRHRRDLSLDDAFVAAVAPRAIIAGNASFPPEELLDLSKVARWRELGIAVFDQRETGGVTVRPEQGKLKLEGFLNRQTAEF
jgi:competence protein ComEC